MRNFLNWVYIPLIRVSLTGLLTAAIFSAVNIQTCEAQDKPKIETPVLQTDSVYFKVDEQPSFPDGAKAFVRFLSSNIKYTKQMKLTQVQGKVIVQFIVEKDGSLTNIKAIKGPGGGTSEEAVRVMQKSPKWQPGIKDGKPVRVQFAAPITFVYKFEEPKNDDLPLTFHNN
ncbi:MAG: energy transducer TonB [Bacteroidota bacterium]